MSRIPESAARTRLPEIRMLVRAAHRAMTLGIAAALSFGAASALAGPPPGAVIYVRDVPTRQAQLPGQPGKPSYVDAGPNEMILGATGVGMKPLTDEQAGSISAPMQAVRAGGTAPAGVESGLGSAHPFAGGGGALERSGGIVGGTVGSAVAQVNSALSAVSGSLGGPR